MLTASRPASLTSAATYRSDPRAFMWLRPVMALVVLTLAGLTVATMFIEDNFFPMPASHLVIVPIAVSIIALVWFAELRGLGWPRWLFALMVTLPNIWLALVGHSLLNLLFQMLLAGWIGTWETQRIWRGVGLAIALAPIVLSAAMDAGDGAVSVTTWLSWSAGIGAMWVVGYALAAQQRLVLELRETQATLARQTRETERMRLAQEMHDSATQSMYAARMYTEAALRMLGAGDTATAAAHVREARDAIRDASAELRILIHDLRPSLLEDQGLVTALRLRLEAVEGRAGVKTEFISEPETSERMSIEMEQELYRLAQECLNNTLKHARASRVSVTLRQTTESVTLEITYDGAGFDVSASVNGGGLGLRSMQERASRLGGKLDLASTPGSGTRMMVEVPL